MKKITAVLSTAMVLSSFNANAEGNVAPWLDVSGSINFDGTTSKNADWDKDFKVQDAELRFEILAREGMKLVIKAELEDILNKYINDEDIDVELEKVLEEAYIQIQTDRTLGLPRAVITLGKHRMAFAQRLAELPMFKDSLLYKLTNEEEMIGITVALPANFMKIVDEVAISLYETGAGDMDISTDKGVSVKMSKKLSQQVQMQISALMKEHNGQADKETRGSVGFVFTSDDGSMKVWAQGLVVRHNPEYVDSRYGAAIGAAKKLGVGAVVVEASTLENVGKELAFAYNMPVGSYLVLSPEVRFTKSAADVEDTVVGIRARIDFAKKNQKLAGKR